MSILPEIIINTIMLYVSHPATDIINEGPTINDAFGFTILKDDYKLWFRDYDKEFRRQDIAKEKWNKNKTACCSCA